MIKKQLNDKILEEHLKNLNDDTREVFLLEDNSMRATIINATTLINQMRANHELGVVESLVLGQAYIASALLSATVKANDRIQLTIECGGPIGGVYTEAWACGAVRGYLKNNPIELKAPLTSFDTSELYGPGFLTISKLIEGNKAPFTGQVMLESGNLAQDLATYFIESEQTPSLFNLSIDFDKDGRIMGAGGLFIQALPGCSDEVLIKMEEKAKNLPSLGKSISSNIDIKEYITSNFENTNHLAHESVGFSCPCSKDNFRNHLFGLPKNEKEAILRESTFPLVLSCFNCNSQYEFSREEIEKIFK
ncbi:MAG: Hsp33 family molecular chaperone HslO [Spirochaetia bacterium]|nr:Hsp33 family molecular chaperone HslO [Spirochaetia bacterium]